MKKNNNNTMYIAIAVILIIIVGVTGFYLGSTFRNNENELLDKAKENTTDNQKGNNEEIKEEENTIEPSVKKYNFEIISQKNNNKLTTGDQVKLNSEEFYVVSSNSNETVLLAKYNLYVGEVIREIETEGIVDSWTDNFKYIKTITKDDEKYGLQSSEAKGDIEINKDGVGVVGFSGNTYWLKNNKLLNKYSNDNIYDSSLSKEPMDMNENHFTIKNNNYTIAYFLEEYVNKLKSYTDTNISGRLLLISELKKLGCKFDSTNQDANCDNVPEWIFTSSYWLGSFIGGSERVGYFVAAISYKANEFKIEDDDNEYNIDLTANYNDSRNFGIRPVLIVKTSDIK